MADEWTKIRTKDLAALIERQDAMAKALRGLVAHAGDSTQRQAIIEAEAALRLPDYTVSHIN